MRKNLHGSEKCCTFATAFEKIAYGAIAQLVEQRTENPCVTGSNPVGTTVKKPSYDGFFCFQARG